jgi:hypothetical protein
MPSLPSIWQVEWLNSNSQRKYPLHEDAGVTDTSGSVKIPNDFIVDLLWPVHVDDTVDPEKFHILRIATFGTGVTVSIGYDGTAVGSVSIDSASFTPNQTFFIQGVGDFFDTFGKIIIGSLSNILKLAGSFEFDLANGRLEATVIKPDLRGVNAIYLQNGTDLSAAIQGDVVFQAGRNFLMTFDEGDGTPADPHKIVFNAVEGAGLNTECACDEATEGPCIKRINGIEPDGSGDFFISGSECVTLASIANGVQLTDECAKPCCGCAELEIVTNTLKDIVAQINGLEGLALRLETNILQMEFNLINSTPWLKP